jgi:hypothetical protein
MHNHNLYSLLDLREKINSDIPQKFSIIAEEMFNNYEIVKSGQRYRFLEIEFYYHSAQHNDSSTYERTCNQGWFFHQSGVDISFNSDDKGKEYGGILIRSIENLDTKEIISGPIRVVNTLFDYIKFNSDGSIDASSIPNIVPTKDRFNVTYYRAKRFHIPSEGEYRYFDDRAIFDGNKQYIKRIEY